MFKTPSGQSFIPEASIFQYCYKDEIEFIISIPLFSPQMGDNKSSYPSSSTHKVALIPVELHTGSAFYITMPIKGTEAINDKGSNVAAVSVGTPYRTLPADPHPESPEPFSPTGWGRGSAEASLAGVLLLLLPPNHTKNMVTRGTTFFGKHEAAARLQLWHGQDGRRGGSYMGWCPCVAQRAGEAGVGTAAVPLAGTPSLRGHARRWKGSAASSKSL